MSLQSDNNFEHQFIIVLGEVVDLFKETFDIHAFQAIGRCAMSFKIQLYCVTPCKIYKSPHSIQTCT